MHKTLKACAAAFTVVLAGCEAPEVHYTVAGLEAFRAGDKPALEKAQAELAKLNPAPATAPTPCSRDDFGQRRARAFADLLTYLDSQWADSDTENLRYFRLQTTSRMLMTDDLPPFPDACQPAADRDFWVLTDTSERVQVVKGLRDVLVTWGTSLGHVPIATDPAASTTEGVKQ